MAPAFAKQMDSGEHNRVAVDDRDHVYIVHRGNDGNFATQEIGITLALLNVHSGTTDPEFDLSGSLVNAWGGPGDRYTWPASNRGIEIASNGDVWIGGNGGGDSHVLVLLKTDNSCVKSVCREPTDSNSTEHFSRVAEAIDSNKRGIFCGWVW